MKIIHKYVLREHAGPLVFAVSALTSLLMLNYIAKRFGDLVGKGLPWSIILKFFGLSVPFTVAMTFPMAVLVATLYAFSRLAAENEITALKASGVSLVRLLTPVLIAAAFLSAGMVYFNDQVLPKANHRLRTLQGDIARKKPTFALKEQVINEVSPGKLFLRANHLDEFSNRMQEITIYDLSDPLRRRTIYADSGQMAFAPNGTDLVLTLYRGHMIEVPKENPLQLKRLYYNVDFVQVPNVADSLSITSEDTYKSDREMSVCELQGEVARNELEYEKARSDLRRALIGAAREAVTGAPPALPPDTTNPELQLPGRRAPRSPKASLGRAYCDAQAKLAELTGNVGRKGLALMTPASAFAREVVFPAARDPRVPSRSCGLKSAVCRLDQDTTKAKKDSTKKDTTRAKPRPTKRPNIVPNPGMPPNINPQLPIDDTSFAAPHTSPARQGGQTTSVAPASGFGNVPPGTVLPGAKSGPPPNDSAGLYSPATPAIPPRPGVTPGPAYPSSGVIPSQPYIVSAAVEGARSRMKDSQERADQNAVELHKKFAISVACFVFVLVGAPIALRFPRAGVGLVIGVSLAVFAVYYVGLIGGEALADRGYLPPALAMWSTNILLTIIGLMFLARIGREGATARGGDMGEIAEMFRNAFGRVTGRRRRRLPAAPEATA